MLADEITDELPDIRRDAIEDAKNFRTINDASGFPTLKRANLGSFVVRNIFTDFKRHDLGPNFHEINFDGTIRTHFLTMPLWGVGTSANYGHDGRSHDLMTVILRHGDEAQQARDNFANASATTRRNIIALLNTLILFPPDDTSSSLDAAVPPLRVTRSLDTAASDWVALFNDPNDPE